MTKQKDVAVYIGRFNPFHLGHAYVLKRALNTYKKVIVLIGSAGQARTLKNPFTFQEREQMILKWSLGFDYDAELIIEPLPDSPYSDNEWILNVQSLVSRRTTVEDGKIFLTGSDRDDSTWYLKSFPQWKLDLVDAYTRPPEAEISATSVRKILYEEDITVENFEQLLTKVPASTQRFLWSFALAGGLAPLREEHRFIKAYKKAWSVAPHAPTFMTADAVVIQSGHVLVVVRGNQPGKGLWALPGGFVNQTERVKDAAVRELIEETGIKLAEGKRSLEITKAMLAGSIKAAELFDLPDRSARGRTFTQAYLFRLDDSKPLPLVAGQNVPEYEANGQIIPETLKAMWVPLNEAIARSDQWFEDHHAILKWGASIKDN